MTQAASYTGYSSKVSLELVIENQTVPLAQIGGDRLFFDHPVEFTSDSGEVVMNVDGVIRRWRVSLSNGKGPSRVIEATFADPT